MTLRFSQLPLTPTSLWESITKLQRDVKELRAARNLENATIGGGNGLVVQNAGAGPSIKVTPNANGIGFLTQVQAAILISTGAATEVEPGIFTCYIEGTGGDSVPAMFMMCPDENTGTAYILLQGGSVNGASPSWQVTAGASQVALTYDYLTVEIGGGQGMTLDGSGLYLAGESWQPLTLNNGWTTFGSGYQSPVFMKKIDGMVQLSGLIGPGTTTGGTQIATLPTGYIPSSDHVFHTSAGAAATADVYVRSTGAVQIQNPTGTVGWLSLSGIRFPL